MDGGGDWDWAVVSLALICFFSRMRSHLGLDAAVKQETVPEETVLAVAEVLRHSSALRVSEDGMKVGRAHELLKPDEIIQQVDSRTIAASPLPYNVKLEDVQSFFAQYGKVCYRWGRTSLLGRRKDCTRRWASLVLTLMNTLMPEKEVKPNIASGIIIVYIRLWVIKSTITCLLFVLGVNKKNL